MGIFHDYSVNIYLPGGKVCFQHDMSYDSFKHLVKSSESEKGLRNKAFKIASNPRYDGYQRELVQWFKTLLIIDLLGIVTPINSYYQKLANELHQPI